MKRIPIPFLLFLAALLFCSAAAAAPDPVPGPADVLPGGDHPGGVWDGVPMPSPARPPDRQWSLRTGMRKGIYDQMLDEEIAAAPDVAVLRSGFYPAWTGLLAEFRESAALAEPDRIAGLAATTPVLIIPSGGLAGLASSEFFRAGLAEYVRSGGVVLCFSQQRGADLSALPVPDGSKTGVSGAGWSEDSGPLFRASLAAAAHPVLVGIRRDHPSVETDGYLDAYPAGASVLLARSDGRPTLILYPVGKGWVAVTTLFSEYSFSRGFLDDEERMIVRNAVLWAKSGGTMAVVTAGASFSAQIAVPGPEQGAAAALRLLVMEDATFRIRDDRSFPLEAKALQIAALPYSYEIPAKAQDGIYHLEYAWKDGTGRQLAPPAETGAGWFAVMPSSAPTATPAVVRAGEPLAPFPSRFSAAPAVVRAGEAVRLNILVRRLSGPAGADDLFVRGAGQERYFKITGEEATVALDLPKDAEGREIAYAVYHAGGRSLARGSIAFTAPQTGGVSIGQPSYRPGQTITVRVAGMGLGAFSATGLGAEYREHISKDRTYEIPVPRSLPSGVYSLAWDFERRDGDVRSGEIPLLISGATVTCSGTAVLQGAGAGAARLRITANDTIKANVQLRLVSPDGNVVPAGTAAQVLAAGNQEISVPFSLPHSAGGVWQLLYALETTLPEGPGFPRQPVLLASGRLLFDAGPAAILDVRTQRPVYLDTANAPVVAASVFTKERARFSLAVDGKPVRTVQIETAGIRALEAPLGSLAQGPHTVRAAVSAQDRESIRNLRFLFGSRLPDLTATVKTAGFSGPVLEVGVGVMNQGKIASGHATASLYEGDPKAGGVLIRSFTVPPLQPGSQHVLIVPWPLERKAGPRTLVAVVDGGSKMRELSTENNSAAFALQVPEVLLTLNPGQGTYAADEEPSYNVAVVNYSAKTFKPLAVDIRVTDPAGRTAGTESVTIPELAPGGSQRFSLPLALKNPVEGTYIIAAQASSGQPVASDSTGFSVLPTLLLKGSLAGTPAVAVPCRPFTIRYEVSSAGNVPPRHGSLRLEISSKLNGQVVFGRDVPFALRQGTAVIGNMGFPPGDYIVVLRGTASGDGGGLEEDFLLAEQPLSVALPVEAKRLPANYPRVLLWAGMEGAAAIDRALAEKILKEAFDQEELYLTIVSTADDFAREARTGVHTSYVLLNPDSEQDTVPVIRQGLARRAGVLLIGSNDRSIAVAGALGFTFGKPLAAAGATISVPAGAVPGIAGTIPLSGTVLPPEKQGARPVAVFPESGRPAILLDSSAGGAIMVMPFSLTQSALTTGLTGMYAVLLRAAVQAVTPPLGSEGGVVAGQVQLSSRAEPVRAQLVVTMPGDAEFIWASHPADVHGATAVFNLTAEPAPRTVLYLFRLREAERKSSAEVLYECEGKYVSQGTVE
jgi:hypothetical protein